MPGIGALTVALVDAANPVVFVRPTALGLTGLESADQVDGPGGPKIAFVAPPARPIGATTQTGGVRARRRMLSLDAMPAYSLGGARWPPAVP